VDAIFMKDGSSPTDFLTPGWSVAELRSSAAALTGLHAWLP
jgi:hypothetical protein